jgi:hypothetical protein
MNEFRTVSGFRPFTEAVAVAAFLIEDALGAASNSSSYRVRFDIDRERSFVSPQVLIRTHNGVFDRRALTFAASGSAMSCVIKVLIFAPGLPF